MQATPDKPINVLGGPLAPCSNDPLTGYFRDSYCNTCDTDFGSHTVCCIMTAEFLAYEKYVGNDLTTPRPEWAFPGLRPGERWCLAATRFLQAHDEGCAPRVRLEATHMRSLDVVSLDILKKYRL